MLKDTSCVARHSGVVVKLFEHPARYLEWKFDDP